MSRKKKEIRRAKIRITTDGLWKCPSCHTEIQDKYSATTEILQCLSCKSQFQVRGSSLPIVGVNIKTRLGRNMFRCIRRGVCDGCEYFESQSKENYYMDQCHNPEFNPVQIKDIKQGRCDYLRGWCFVCKASILRHEKFIIIPSDANNPNQRIRHDKCKPGSVSWFNHTPSLGGTITQGIKECYEMSRKREVEKTMEKAKTVSSTGKNLSVEDINVLGRIKYMAYMDSVLAESEDKGGGAVSLVWGINGTNFTAKSSPGREVKITSPVGSNTIKCSEVKEYINKIKGKV